jgi:hypothetical protein
MRTASLLSLAVTAGLVTACGQGASPVTEVAETASRAPSPPDRDLTLSTPTAPAAEVASALELSRQPPSSTSSRDSRPRPKPRPAPAPHPEAELTPAPIIVPAMAVAHELAEPAPDEDAAAGGRELAPGKTVTVVPASSGPSIEADEDDAWLPSQRPRGILVGGGGTCRPRGGVRGIGIAGRIPVSRPRPRLR